MFNVRLLTFQAMVFLNLRDASQRTVTPMTARAAIWGQSTTGPTPLRNIPRMMIRK